MALIKCPECGKEVSNRAKNCVHCGNPLDMQESNVFSNLNNEINNENHQTAPMKVNKPKQRKLSKGAKVIVAFLAVIVLVIGIVTLTSNHFSDEEEYGLRMVMKYQDILKNPDSLILRSDIAVITYYRDEKTYKYVFFDASGENSYGASVKSTPCFVNGQYLCDSDEIPTIEEYMSMSDAEAREYLGLELALAHWRLYGEDAKEQEDVVASYSVDGEKIAKKLKIKETID